jgi:hypothetical protein
MQLSGKKNLIKEVIEMKKVIVFVILLMPFYVMAQKVNAVDIAKMYMFLNQS